MGKKKPTGFRDRIIDLRRVKASELVPNEKNPRTHGDHQAGAMRGILAEVGWVDGLIVRQLPDGRLKIINGHLRQGIAAEELVPVLVTDLSEAESDKVLLTFDPITELAGTNTAELETLIARVKIETPDLQKMIDELAKQAGIGLKEVVEDEVPPVPKKPRTKPGQLFRLGDHRLLCGDSSSKQELRRLLDGMLADLVFTSPPYNQNIANFSKSGMHRETKWVDNTRAGSYFDNRPESEYQEWQIDAVKTWSMFLSPLASLFYNHKNRFRDKQCISPWTWLEKTGAKVRQEIIWMREGSVTQNMRGFMPVDERIFWMYFGDDFIWNDSTEFKSWSTVWRVNSHKDIGESSHGCAFPVELPWRAIRACTAEGMVVLEPYAGSGTTIIAAEQLARRCCAMELDPAYCDVTIARWEKLTGRKAELVK